MDEEFPETGRLSSCVEKAELQKIADCKEAGSFQAWKFNQYKTNEWLEKKVSKLSAHLKEKRFNVTQSAIAANYVKSAIADDVPESMFFLSLFNFLEIKLNTFNCFYRFFQAVCIRNDCRISFRGYCSAVGEASGLASISQQNFGHGRTQSAACKTTEDQRCSSRTYRGLQQRQQVPTYQGRTIFILILRKFVQLVYFEICRKRQTHLLKTKPWLALPKARAVLLRFLARKRSFLYIIESK